MRLLAIVHESDAGPGVFAEAIADAGADLSHWAPPTESAPPNVVDDYAAVIALGGSMDPDQTREHPWLEGEKRLLGRLLDAGVPLLGVCLGAELLAEAAGGSVERSRTPEIGWYEVRPSSGAAGDPLIGPLSGPVSALEWHSYEFSLPPGATELARSDSCLQAFALGRAAWGIQFHAEVTGPDLDAWIEGHDGDREAFRAQSRAEIAGWNELGRALCRRFLEVARARS
jgi:GMP synthase (glutamine-hydrolysing)